MAYYEGVANNHIDLFNIWKEKLLENGWIKLAEILNVNIAFQSPKLGNVVSPCWVNMWLLEDGIKGFYGVAMTMADSYSSDFGLDKQKNTTSVRVYPLSKINMPYMLTITQRSFVFTTNINNKYLSCYVGLFAPLTYTKGWNYSAVFAMPSVSTVLISHADATVKIPFFDSWAAGGKVIIRTYDSTWQFAALNTFTSNNDGSRIIPCPYRGEYVGTPILLHRGEDYQYGYFDQDSILFVSGFNQSINNTITINGTEYLIIGSPESLGNKNFFAQAKK